VTCQALPTDRRVGGSARLLCAKRLIFGRKARDVIGPHRLHDLGAVHHRDAHALDIAIE
jgi:hypothetical protein